MSTHNLPMPPPLPPVAIARSPPIAKRNELAPLQIRSTAVFKSSNNNSNTSSQRLSLPESTSGSASVSQSSTSELVEVVDDVASVSCASNQQCIQHNESSLASGIVNRNKVEQESQENDQSTCTQHESIEQEQHEALSMQEEKDMLEGEKEKDSDKISETRISTTTNSQSSTPYPWLESSKTLHKDERRKTRAKARKNSTSMTSTSVAANANTTNNSFSTTLIQPSISNTPHDRRLTSKVHRRSLSLAGVAANRHVSNVMNSSHSNNITTTNKVGNSSLTSSSPLLAAMTMTNRSKTRQHRRHKAATNMAAGANASNKTYNFQRSLFTLFIDDCGLSHEHVSTKELPRNIESRQASMVNKVSEYSLTAPEQSSVIVNNNYTYSSSNGVVELLQQVAFTRSRYKKLKISEHDLNWALTLHQASSLRCDEGIFNVGTVHLSKIASLEEFEKDVQLIQ